MEDKGKGNGKVRPSNWMTSGSSTFSCTKFLIQTLPKYNLYHKHIWQDTSNSQLFGDPKKNWDWPITLNPNSNALCSKLWRNVNAVIRKETIQESEEEKETIT